MGRESDFSANIIDELHSWDIQRDEKEVEKGVT